MSTSWQKRQARLSTLLDNDGDEDAEALALDRILHGQSVIGKTSKTTQIDSLRFSETDLDLMGTLEYGQYGVIDLVTCKLDGCVYVRKSTEKRFALKIRDQCSPQFERDILLQARKTNTKWAPHLLCAFQTPTHLNLVMDYAEGGTLWDVLESSPHGGKIPEADLQWWAPQMVSAIHWCHSQGFVHRDIKPHNFVLSPASHLLLIDFGSAAPLLPPDMDGSQRVPQYHCLVPCGTCDYISPEILQAHEEALVALEMADDVVHPTAKYTTGGYGRETDWWSMGAMLYEMAYGITPSLQTTSGRLTSKLLTTISLHFDKSTAISLHLQDLLRRLLTSAELRLGRGNIREIQEHPFFERVDWSQLHDKPKPVHLHLPQFTYSTPVVPSEMPSAHIHSLENTPDSQPFAFSALFQSSPLSASKSVHNTTPLRSSQAASSHSIMREQPIASFIGFSWGPPKDAFNKPVREPSPSRGVVNTPRPLHCLSFPATPFNHPSPSTFTNTPMAQRYPFATPLRPNMNTPYQTLPRASTIRRTAPRRAVSDREAMKLLVDCVGMSARKRVLESGRKPRILMSLSRSSALKELRFDTSVAVVSAGGGVSYKADSATPSESTIRTSLFSSSGSAGTSSRSQELLMPAVSDSDAESDIPPSPSPSPRPGSAMSMMSKRSQTPSASSFRFPREHHSGSISSGDKTRKPVTLSTPAPPSAPADAEPVRESHTTGEILSYNVLDEFDKRYARLLKDIASIEHRLGRISTTIEDIH